MLQALLVKVEIETNDAGSVPFAGNSGYRHLKTATELHPVLFRESLRRFGALNASGIAQCGLTLQTSVAGKTEFSQVRGMK